MPPSQQPEELLNKARKIIDKLEQERIQAEKRREVALGVASSLEERNKGVIDKIERDALALKEKLTAEVRNEIEELKEQINSLLVVKQGLLDEIRGYQEQNLITEDKKLRLDDELLEKQGNVSVALQEFQRIDKDLRDTQEVLTDRLGKSKVLKEEVEELSFTIQQMKDDKEAIQHELEIVTNDLSESHNTFENQAKYYDDQLYEKKEALAKVQLKLIETEKKDKDFRTDWAERQLVLEKREQVVRRLEAKMSNAEARIEELSRFDTL